MKSKLLALCALTTIGLAACNTTQQQPLGPNVANRDTTTGRYFVPTCPYDGADPDVVGAVYLHGAHMYHSLPDVNIPSLVARLKAASPEVGKVKVTTHTQPNGDRYYTIDDAGPRVSHKARRQIATVGNGDDASRIEALWNGAK